MLLVDVYFGNTNNTIFSRIYIIWLKGAIVINSFRSLRFLFIALIFCLPILLLGSCGSSSSSNNNDSESSSGDSGSGGDSGGDSGGEADAGPPMTVLSPDANQSVCQNFQITADSKIQIDIQFSKEVDKSSVLVGQSFIMAHEKGSSADGAITWPNIDTLRFKTTDVTSDLCIFNPDCFFTFTLMGTDDGSGAIKDSDGMALDGDGNETAGGDWTTTCAIIG